VKRRLPARGLYAITSDHEQYSPALLTIADAALRAGAALIQYRRKNLPPSSAQREAAALTSLCEQYGALLIVNDNIELALAAGAHGLHLGREDGDIQNLPEAVRARLLIGISCYNSLALAEIAAEGGADYLAFGSVFISGTKPAAVHCPLSVLSEAKARFGLPVVAIGGITPDNGPAVIQAGADFIAAIGGVFEQSDVYASALRYAQLFQPSEF
jgi:thiamine-phosphate pyrophosphorylase